MVLDCIEYLKFIFSPILNEKVKIEVFATHTLQQLTYQVLGKGDVLLSGIFQVQNKTDFQFEFTPSLAMVPNANVIVYYITSDGEIISDSLQIEFGNELKNYVSYMIQLKKI